MTQKDLGNLGSVKTLPLFPSIWIMCWRLVMMTLERWLLFRLSCLNSDHRVNLKVLERRHPVYRACRWDLQCNSPQPAQSIKCTEIWSNSHVTPWPCLVAVTKRSTQELNLFSPSRLETLRRKMERASVMVKIITFVKSWHLPNLTDHGGFRFDLIQLILPDHLANRTVTII